MSDILTQLNSTYETPGWEHFENWIDNSIKNCIESVMNPTTPKEEVDKMRLLAYSYRTILDKVEADKANYKTSLQG